jgi:hypothetical protein
MRTASPATLSVTESDLCDLLLAPRSKHALGRSPDLTSVGGEGQESAQLRRPLPRSAMSAVLKGFGRRPFAGALGLGAGRASESLVRRKPRGGRGAVWLGGSYGDFGVAEGSPMWWRGWKAADVIVRSEHDALFRGRGCERRVWARRLERVCGGREDIGFVLRRVVGDEDDRRCAAGSAAIVMMCRS